MIFRLGLAFIYVGALANALECYVGSSIKDNVEATQCKEDEQACVTESRLVSGLSNNKGRNLTYTKRCAKSCAETYQHFPSWISADGKTWITERDANIRSVCCEFKKCNRPTTFFGDSWPHEEESATKPGIKCYSGWEEKGGRDTTQVVQCAPNQRACFSIAEPIYPHYGFKEPESVTKSCGYSCAAFDRKIHLQHAKGYFSDVAFVSRNQTDKTGRRWWQTEMLYEDEHGQNQTLPTRTMCCEKGFCNEDTIYYSETSAVLDPTTTTKLDKTTLSTTTDATSESTTTEETAEAIASPAEENGTNRPIHMLSVTFGLIAISLLL